MSDATKLANQHLREALALLQKEESDRLALFNQEMAELRHRITGIRSMLPLSHEKPSSGPEVAQPVLASPKATRSRRQRQSEVVVPQELVARIQGMSQPEAVIQIARHYDGVVRTVIAKPIMIQAKVITGASKNAIGHLFDLLGSEERFRKHGVYFEKIGPGTFRMIERSSKSVTDAVDIA